MNHSKRLLFIDFLKGIAILCVVIGHIAAFNPKCNILIDFIYSFHMPLFFFISGYLYQKSSVIDIKFNVLKKISSLLVPYIAISILAIIIHGCSVESIRGYFFSETRWGYWFLPTLFILFLFLIIYRKILHEDKYFILVVIFTEFCFLLLKKYLPPFYCELLLVRHLVTYWPFIILGLYMNRIKIRLPLILFCLLAWLNIVALNFYYGISNEILRTLGRFFAIFGLYGFFVLYPNIDFKNVKIIMEMGKSSLTIYIFHYFLLPLTEKYIERLNHIWSAVPMTIALALIISLCCYFFEVYILKKNRILSKLFIGK